MLEVSLGCNCLHILFLFVAGDYVQEIFFIAKVKCLKLLYDLSWSRNSFICR